MQCPMFSLSAALLQNPCDGVTKSSGKSVVFKRWRRRCVGTVDWLALYCSVAIADTAEDVASFMKELTSVVVPGSASSKLLTPLIIKASCLCILWCMPCSKETSQHEYVQRSSMPGAVRSTMCRRADHVGRQNARRNSANA